MKIKTNLLKDMLSKAVKGASCNKMLPLTSLISIEVVEGNLILTTTDGNNYLYVAEKCEGDISVVVDVTLFSSLVSKFTSVDVELNVEDNVLVVKGNGTYKIAIPVDENGEPIKFQHKPTWVPEETFTISEETYKKIIKTNKNSLAISLAEPCYTGYYVGNRVLTTDSYKICANDNKLVETPILVSADTMKLLDLFTEEVEVDRGGNAIILRGDKMRVEGNLMSGIENFNADTINTLVDKEYPYIAEVNRATLLNALERIALFVSPFDKNNVILKFVEEGIKLSSLSTTGVELIKYTFKNEVGEFECAIDVNTLKQQIASQEGDNVEIHYGEESSIKMIDGDTTQIIALGVE